MYLLKTYSNMNKFSLTKIKTSENILSVSVQDSDSQNSFETGGWKLLSILNDIPKVCWEDVCFSVHNFIGGEGINI